MEIEQRQEEYREELRKRYSELEETRIMELSEKQYEKYLRERWRDEKGLIYAEINGEDSRKKPQKKDIKTIYKRSREEYIEDRLDSKGMEIGGDFTDYIVNVYMDD